MNKSTPYFSIVMPTRNRAHLLPYALQSALDQTFQDYEIVLSDNCSSDETGEVVRRCDDTRLRYFRTDRALSMPDSWEFALSKARGEWVAFLGDDDAFCPALLEKVAEVIQKPGTTLVAWPGNVYVIDSHVPELRGQLTSPCYTRRILTLDAQSQLRRLFKLEIINSPVFPRFINSAAHRALVHKVKSQLGRVFLPPCPDFTSGAAMLANADNYTFIDVPLFCSGSGCHVWGHSSTYGRSTPHLLFIEDFQGSTVTEHVPLRCLFHTNLIAESLLRVRKAMPDRFSACDLSWVPYFAACYFDILLAGRFGFDTSSDRREFTRVLAEHPRTVQLRLRILSVSSLVRSLLRSRLVYRTVARSAILTYLLSVAKRRRVHRERFSNILEAARYWNDKIRAGT